MFLNSFDFLVVGLYVFFNMNTLVSKLFKTYLLMEFCQLIRDLDINISVFFYLPRQELTEKQLLFVNRSEISHNHSLS